LRLAIGWHFYKEGVSHHTDPAWSSEGFLRQAKGPLADRYQSILPDFHGWNRLMLAPLAEQRATETAAGDAMPATDAKEPNQKAAAQPDTKAEPDTKTATEESDAAAKPSADQTADKHAVHEKAAGRHPAKKKAAANATPAYDAWLKAAHADWAADADRFAEYYHFDDAQKAKAKALVADAVRRVTDGSLDDHGNKVALDGLENEEPDIRLYRELVARAQAMPSAPGAGQIPNELARSTAAQQNPLGERGISGQASPLTTLPAAWQANAQAVEQLFHDRLRGLLTKDQREMAVPPSDADRLHRIDLAIGWLLMIVGGLLIVGLFTRLAAVVGALFLLSIICAQPPWLATSVQTYTYNQAVEMLALLALATTPVGRWCGLDFFIGLLCRRCCRSQATTLAGARRSNPPPSTSVPPVTKTRIT
jgi:uncharacterized membrane protein YphA (DoxX/SURF4 family)